MDVSRQTKPTGGEQAQLRSKHSARCRIRYSDADIVDHFRRLGYVVSYGQLAFTTETVADFAQARLDAWHRPGHVAKREDGLLIVEGAQPHPRQRSRDIVVVSLGYARVVMGTLNPPDCRIGVPRYAKTM